MIWPWSELKRLQKQVHQHELERVHLRAQADRCLLQYCQVSREMRGAHKGIWRLKEKLKWATYELNALRHMKTIYEQVIREQAAQQQKEEQP